MESANSASAAALKLPTSVRPRRGLQFGLLTLLCVVTVLGCVLGKWFYYRPLTVMVDARLTFVDRDAASAIIAKHELHGVHDSPYSWLILADDELPELLKNDGKLVKPLGTTGPRAVSSWPQTAMSSTYAHSDFVRLSPIVMRPVHEIGSIGGFIGSRIAGIERQLRVECNVTFHHPNYKALTVDHPDEQLRLKGKLFYEGAMPDGHLVFLAPLGEEEFSAIIFDVK
jgi:hypothetical protein